MQQLLLVLRLRPSFWRIRCRMASLAAWSSMDQGCAPTTMPDTESMATSACRKRSYATAPLLFQAAPCRCSICLTSPLEPPTTSLLPDQLKRKSRNHSDKYRQAAFDRGLVGRRRLAHCFWPGNYLEHAFAIHRKT